MGQGAGEYGSAAGGGGSGFSARIRVGRFVLDVGSPAGTRADRASGPPAAADELRVALAEPAPAGGLAQAEQELGAAESTTGRVERALELFTAVAQGRILDPDFLRRETDSLLAALERADREGRHEDAIRLARVLSRLLALTGRWVALVGTLRVALRSAAALGDAPGIAWARHELGTLSLAAEDAEAATGQLTEALRLRRELGNPAEIEVTEHNLEVARAAFRSGPSGATIAVIAAAVVLAVAAALAIALTRDDDEPAADTRAPQVEITSGPDDPTEETSATFEFEADEPVERFECRLDDGAFAECVSPFNTPGTLAPGEHVFAVRATDLAGNRSDPVEYAWTVERGRGPTVAIIDGPNPLTNQTRAQFTIDPGDAVTLECRLDDEPFETCPTMPAYPVGEGDHLFTVRGRDAAGTAGPPARRAWTVDTTPPTVEITDSEIGETTATIAFTPSEDVRELRCTLTTDADVEPPPEPECVSPVVYEGLADGTAWVFEVRATDLAGNVGPPARLEFETEPIVE